MIGLSHLNSLLNSCSRDGCLDGHCDKSNPWPGDSGKSVRHLHMPCSLRRSSIHPSPGKNSGLRKLQLCHIATLDKRQLGCPPHYKPHMGSPLAFIYPISNTASNSTSGSHRLATCACLQLISLDEVFGNGMSQSFS